MSSAGADYWDRYFAELRKAGRDLDWEGRWTDPFLGALRAASVQSVLELGCGTGNDAARLAREGYAVTAVDLSEEAIRHARAEHGARVTFLVADVTAPLPFQDESFDAVLANVALHMFPDGVTRSVFTEVGRVVRQGGLFLFHVNALEDRPLRERRRRIVGELEPNFVLEEGGQTMHFFSSEYLEDLLAGWRDLDLEAVEIADATTGEPFKRVWRGTARR